MADGPAPMPEPQVPADVPGTPEHARGVGPPTFYHLLEDAPLELMLLSAHHAKNLPGSKTHVLDAVSRPDPGTAATGLEDE